MVNQNKFPVGWDEDRVLGVIAHYEGQTDEDAVAEDEIGMQFSETIVNVPHELVSKVRELIAKRQS